MDQQAPRLTPLLPSRLEAPLPPRIIHNAALLLGGKSQLARLLNVTASTVSQWLSNGYPVDAVCRLHFTLMKHIKELEEFNTEVEHALTTKISKRGYRFPPDRADLRVRMNKVNP